MKNFFKRGSTWTALAGIATAIGAVVTGHANIVQAFQAVLTSLLGMSIHTGVANSVTAVLPVNNVGE